MFPTDYQSIINRIAEIEPTEYAKSRNFINGKVSYLSPYISRGVISTKQVWESLKNRGIYVGEFAELKAELGSQPIHFKEHLLTKHYQGQQSERSAVSGYSPSFFGYWKKCQKYLY